VSGVSTFEIRRGGDRARTRTEWLDSWHSFAFGSHYDPDNTGFGVLVAHNHDVLRPWPGYPAHAHRDIEILTWVLAGSLVHQDLAGTSTVVQAGQLHHLSAGSGIRHTEFSAGDQPVHVVQMWLTPDEPGGPASHQSASVGDRLDSGELVEIASGLTAAGDGVLRIRQRAAALSVARPPAGATVRLPAARHLHAYLAAGSATVEAADGQVLGTLAAGDALRITGGGGERLTACAPAELLVWRMEAGLG